MATRPKSTPGAIGLLALVGAVVVLVFGYEHLERKPRDDRIAKNRETVAKLEALAERDPVKAWEIAKQHHLAGNIEKRNLWTEKAAELGNIEAAENLVILAARAGDDPGCLRWLAVASKNGSGLASWTLACDHYHGTGLIPANKAKAMTYLELAASQGHPRAKEVLPESKAKGIEAVGDRLRLTDEDLEYGLALHPSFYPKGGTTFLQNH